jgi:hypothetical protein
LRRLLLEDGYRPFLSTTSHATVPLYQKSLKRKEITDSHYLSFEEIAVGRWVQTLFRLLHLVQQSLNIKKAQKRKELTYSPCCLLRGWQMNKAFFISCNSPFITKKPKKKRNNRFLLLLSSEKIAVSGGRNGPVIYFN